MQGERGKLETILPAICIACVCKVYFNPRFFHGWIGLDRKSQRIIFEGMGIFFLRVFSLLGNFLKANLINSEFEKNTRSAFHLFVE